MRRPLPTAEVEGERSASDPLAEAIRRADLAAIWAALADLPQQQRDALLLREFSGLSYQELAAALAVSGPAVESLLFRARQGVRARLAAGYAGLTGGTWIDSLARLGSVIGGGVAPVAAKVAAVGVGAAVATGGAVVAPRLLEHRQHHSAPATRAVARSAVTPLQVAAASTPISVAHAASRHTVAAVRRSIRGTDEHASSSDNQATGGDRGSTDHGSASGDERKTTSEHARGQETDGTQETGSRPQSGDGSSSQDGQQADAPEPGDGTPPPAGDGGVAPTTPNPALTVTVPTGDAPPPVGEPTPSSDDGSA